MIPGAQGSKWTDQCLTMTSYEAVLQLSIGIADAFSLMTRECFGNSLQRRSAAAAKECQRLAAASTNGKRKVKHTNTEKMSVRQDGAASADHEIFKQQTVRQPASRSNKQARIQSKRSAQKARTHACRGPVGVSSSNSCLAFHCLYDCVFVLIVQRARPRRFHLRAGRQTDGSRRERVATAPQRPP